MCIYIHEFADVHFLDAQFQFTTQFQLTMQQVSTFFVWGQEFEWTCSGTPEQKKAAPLWCRPLFICMSVDLFHSCFNVLTSQRPSCRR